MKKVIIKISIQLLVAFLWLLFACYPFPFFNKHIIPFSHFKCSGIKIADTSTEKHNTTQNRGK